ncbi:MAG: hypothetical protein IRY91_15625 [Gemmatimonadaceae bacterium]|nr:hypothetical protein [Gemmatimonadaceae bacterium]
MHRTLIAIVLAAAIAAPAAAQQTSAGGRETDDTFDWSGEVGAGNWLRIRNINGSIEVAEATGATAEVHAQKQWRRGDPRRVHFAVVKDGGNVTVCALWHDDDTCDANGVNSHHHHDHDDGGNVSVHFTVKLPKGVKVDVGTINGSVSVTGAGAEVVATTVNGRVDAATSSGPVRATAVNGSVHARMDALPPDVDLEYRTVNGSVTVELPASFDADVEMTTVNGTLRSDFPLTVNGRINPRHIRAVIGKGGRRLQLETVNGSVELRKLS